MSGIMIVDDDVVSVMELEEILSNRSYKLAGTAFSGVEAVEMAKQLKPDLILMDIKMPGVLDGISASELILEDYDLPIIFITGHDDQEILERASKLNPAAYIVKPFIGKQIITAIEMALLTIHAKNNNTEKRFSTAETPIVNLIKKGKTSKEIAMLLNLSKKTVDWHRTNIRAKLEIDAKEDLFSYFQKKI